MAVALTNEQKIIKELIANDWVLEFVPEKLNYDQIKELYQWCYQTFGENRAQLSHRTFMYEGVWAGGTLDHGKKPQFYIGFQNESDYTLYKLRYPG